MDQGWRLAGELRVGEAVRLLDGGEATVVALWALPGVGPMWDLSLDAVHTFAVGNVQAVVHNCPYGPNDPGFTPAAKSSTPQGELTNGTYTISNAKMAAHLPGTATDPTKSVFASGYDAQQGVLNAAQYADENGLWSSLNQARVNMGEPVGIVNPAGTPTTWIAVVRNASGFVHGWPVGGP